MRVSRVSADRGFTLVELMVTLALFTFLVLIGLPLTRSWVQSVHQRDAVGILIDGVGRAKAIALRDPQALADQSKPVAVACLVDGALRVVTADADGVSCGQTPVWNQQVPADISVLQVVDRMPFKCVAYSERGAPLSVAVDGTACTQTSLEVEVGTDDYIVENLP